MDRRNFLRRAFAGLAGTAALATLDVDRLLWLPSDRTIFLPTHPVEIDTVWITREVQGILERNLAFASAINRQYDQSFRAGDVLTVRLPQRFVHNADPGDRLRTAVANSLRLTV